MNFIKMLLQKIRVIMITRVKGEGNVLKIEGKIVKTSKIRVNGNNNTITIEKGRYKNIEIRISGDNHKLLIKSSNDIGNLLVIMQNSTNEIFIDEQVYIGSARIVTCGIKNKISIGKQCLISDNVEIWGCDGHSILQDGKVINYSMPIDIQSNVWIGSSVKILKATKIGKNSVVGMGSILTGKEYPANTIIGGIPAKIIKENVTWTLENLETNFPPTNL